MQNKSVKETLKDLHDSYIVTPVDKAKGNEALISKRFYARTSFRELAITTLDTTKTYVNDNNINHKTILEKYSDDLLRYFGISVSKDNKRVPSIYWLPKLRKS